MALFVPDASFAGAGPNSYLYLYSHFGAMPGAGAGGGYEQWCGPSTPPTQARRPVRSISRAELEAGTNAPLVGCAILLQGTDSQGNTVNLMATTDANGMFVFTFANLAAGTYTIIQQVPSNEFEVSCNNSEPSTESGSARRTCPTTSSPTSRSGPGRTGINYIFFDGNNSLTALVRSFVWPSRTYSTFKFSV